MARRGDLGLDGGEGGGDQLAGAGAAVHALALYPEGRRSGYPLRPAPRGPDAPAAASRRRTRLFNER